MIDLVHSIEIVVGDQDRALAFYVDVLGMEKREDNPFPGGGRWLTVGIPGTETAIALGQPETHDGQSPGGPTGISLTTTDIHGDHERLLAAGVSFTQPPSQMPWGAWATWFSDPDGNVFYLIESDRS